MKRLAFLTFTIATLIAPIQVHAQQYVTFPPDFPPGSKSAAFKLSSGCSRLSVTDYS